MLNTPFLARQYLLLAIAISTSHLLKTPSRLKVILLETNYKILRYKLLKT